VGALKGSTNEEKVYYFLKEKMGLNTAAACGVLANIRAESNFEPNLGNLAYGICQWTSNRKSRLISYCQEKGYNYQSLEGQLYYLDYELSSFYSGVLSSMKAVSNSAEGAYEAGYIWCKRFEIPADLEGQSQSRGRVARDTYWPRYGTSGEENPPAGEDDPPGEEENPPAGEDDPNAPVSFSPWDGGGRIGVGERNAAIGQTITLRWGNCTETGMYLYDAKGKLLGKGVNRYYSYHVYFWAQEECGVKLSPGTTYRYLFYAIVNGKEYTGGAGSFTTRGTASTEPSTQKVVLLFEAAGGSAVKSISLEPGEALDSIPDTTRSGYSFIGWYTKEGEKLKKGMSFYEDTTFTALWEKKAQQEEPGEESTQGLRLKPASVVLYLNTSDDDKKLEVIWDGTPSGNVTFSSSDTKVAKVSQKGKVTAKKKGTATITASVKVNGKTYKATCKVTVKKAKISAPSTLTLKKGTSSILGASVKPLGQLTFKSSNTSIATVSASGKVTGVKKGSCTITIESYGVKKKVKVKVK
ncbi:MAG: Ig-like domain-containing protein, partial [Blautia sp.]|nr:Ig-like domain-containing protein [Blautia sp.]